MPARKKLNDFKMLFKDAADKGMLLFFAAVLALIISNSNHSNLYNTLFYGDFKLIYDESEIKFTLNYIINDIFMVVFFFLVGLEIKREILNGYLSSPSQRTLPIWCAVGGTVVPALIYYTINLNSSEFAIRGWAIPAATDIAFALGVFAFFGKRLPLSLKVFLTALAIIDDLIAVMIIAIFYSTGIQLDYIAMIICVCLLVIAANRLNISNAFVYSIAGLIMWYLFHEAGIHATVAGVLLAMFVPLQVKKSGESLSLKYEKALYPIVAYVVLPLFAFANSGVSLNDVSHELFTHTVTLGIILGLLFGKQIGIFGLGYILIKLKKAKLPEGANMIEFYAVSVMCGIGFTMSLFIGKLAFSDSNDYTAHVKVGVLLGSFLSVLLSIAVIKLSHKK